YTYILKYSGRNLSDLTNNLESGCRNVINRAQKYNLFVEESSDFAEFYQLVSLTYSRQGLKFRVPFEQLKRLDDSIKSHGNRLILKAKDTDGHVHAGIYIAYNKRSAFFLLSGADPEYRRIGGHTLVFWEAIKFFQDKVEYCNFGGSDIQRIESHLRCFGGELTPYFHIYNEHAIEKGIRHHLKELSFHINGLLKASTKRFLSPVHNG
ncbi:MAG: GNAT family N-acetyltransferase, partial [Methanococcaceae archaeon]